MIYIPWKTESMNEDTILFGDDQGKRQTILLILSTIFENIVEVISLCSLELELDHVNPLHPYIHNYVYSPY